MDITASMQAARNFLWACLSSPLFLRLSSPSIHTAIVNYLRPVSVLVDILCDRVCIFNLQTQIWSSEPHTEVQGLVSYASTWLVLGWTEPNVYSLFCCGGAGSRGEADFGWWDSAYRIDTGKAVLALPNMLKARGNHGLIEWHSHVYAFGGCKAYTGNEGKLTHCEKLSLTLNQAWQALPSMSEGRQFLSPCLFRDIAYLCGGYGTDSIEGFDCLRQRFLPRKVQLPEAQACCVWVEKGLICLQSRGYMIKYVPSGSGLLQEMQRIPLPRYGYKYQNSLPVFDPVHSLVYFLFEGKVAYILTTEAE